MKNKAYYFSHDGNAHNDVKIQYLTADLGMEGYGIFWYLIEKLFEAGGILPLKIVKILAKQMNVSEAKAKTVIEAYGLFQITEDSFYSQRLMRHFEAREKLSISGKKGAEIKWGGYSEANGEAIDTPIARKEKKENEKKIKENNIVNSDIFNESNSEENFTVKNLEGAKEGLPSPTDNFDWNSTKKSFFNSDEWMYQFCTAKGVSKDRLTQLMNEFVNDIELRNEFKNLKELKNHFTNWFNKSSKIQKNVKPTRNAGAYELLDELRAEYQAGLTGNGFSSSDLQS